MRGESGQGHVDGRGPAPGQPSPLWTHQYPRALLPLDTAAESAPCATCYLPMMFIFLMTNTDHATWARPSAKCSQVATWQDPCEASSVITPFSR